jgi:hypothetical protein
VRKLFLLFLLAVAAVLGLVILFRQYMNVPMGLFNLLADVSIGLIMGVGSRLVLRRRHWLLRAITATALSVVGLALLGWLTAARSGIGPVTLESRRVHWLDQAHIALRIPTPSNPGTMDLMDLAHMVIAVDTSWLALRAWQRRSRVSRASTKAPAVLRPSLIAAPARMAAMPSAPVPQVRPRAISRTRPPAGRKKIGRPRISGAALAVRPDRSTSRRRSVFRRRPEVQLAAYEAHRCPYCLEDVNRNDARGSVECPVCHTLHHKDCWDITGTCQVPHLNA